MATDTIQLDTPAIDGGGKYAQFFVGIHSLLSDVHGMKSLASFLGVLIDQIIDHGEPMKLISDPPSGNQQCCMQHLLHLWYLFLVK
jgi:hypothetical protein